MRLDMMNAWQSKPPSKPIENNVPISPVVNNSLSGCSPSQPPVKPTAKKQVSLSWLVVLAIVLIPLVTVVASISWYMFWQRDTAYIEPEVVVIRAQDDIFIKSIKAQGTRVKSGDLLSEVYLSGQSKWIEQSMQISRITKTTNTGISIPLGGYQQVVSLASNKVKSANNRYESLRKNVNGFVTPKELLDAMQDVQESRILLGRANIDLAVARAQNHPSSEVNLESEFKNMKTALNTTILSPIDGQIVKTLVNANEQVSKGQELMQVAGFNSFYIDLHLNGADALKKRIGSSCNVWFPDGTKITAHIINYIRADSNGVVIARMKPDSKIDNQYMIPGLPVGTRCD